VATWSPRICAACARIDPPQFVRSAPDPGLVRGASRSASAERDAGVAVGRIPRGDDRRIRIFLVHAGCLQSPVRHAFYLSLVVKVPEVTPGGVVRVSPLPEDTSASHPGARACRMCMRSHHPWRHRRWYSRTRNRPVVKILSEIIWCLYRYFAGQQWPSVESEPVTVRHSQSFASRRHRLSHRSSTIRRLVTSRHWLLTGERPVGGGNPLIACRPVFTVVFLSDAGESAG
jgi:hypothetical protein